MQAKEAIQKRRSVRNFNQKPIADNLIEGLIDSARFAATARNIQPWEFIAVKDKNTLKELAALTDNGKFIADCACCIAVFCKDTKYYLEDGCAAVENILISAADSGIGSCWVAGDKKPYCGKVAALLAVPDDFKLVSLIALGYSDDLFQIPEKRPLNEVLHWEKF